MGSLSFSKETILFDFLIHRDLFRMISLNFLKGRSYSAQGISLVKMEGLNSGFIKFTIIIFQLFIINVLQAEIG